MMRMVGLAIARSVAERPSSAYAAPCLLGGRLVGRTAGFGPTNGGSNPSPTAVARRRRSPANGGPKSCSALEPCRMPRHVAARGRASGPPARPALAAPGRVEAQPRHHEVGVAAVGVDGHPLPATARSPALEVARVERLGDQVGAVERVTDGARTVERRVVEPAAVTASIAVRRVGDLVCRGDHFLNLNRSVSRGLSRPAVARDPGLLAWNGIAGLSRLLRGELLHALAQQGLLRSVHHT